MACMLVQAACVGLRMKTAIVDVNTSAPSCSTSQHKAAMMCSNNQEPDQLIRFLVVVTLSHMHPTLKYLKVRGDEHGGAVPGLCPETSLATLMNLKTITPPVVYAVLAHLTSQPRHMFIRFTPVHQVCVNKRASTNARCGQQACMCRSE